VEEKLAEKETRSRELEKQVCSRHCEFLKFRISYFSDAVMPPLFLSPIGVHKLCFACLITGLYIHMIEKDLKVFHPAYKFQLISFEGSFLHRLQKRTGLFSLISSHLSFLPIIGPKHWFIFSSL
jgi:hypothetical protein